MTVKTKRLTARVPIGLTLAATLLGVVISGTLFFSSNAEPRSATVWSGTERLEHAALLPERDPPPVADLGGGPLLRMGVLEESRELRVQFFDEETDLPLAGVAVAADSGRAAVSDADGVALVSLAEAQFVSFVREGYWARTVLLEEHDVDSSERIEYLATCGEILGTVSDTTGRALENISVRIVESGVPPGLARELAAGRTGPDGEFVLALPGHLAVAQHMDLVVDAQGSVAWSRNVSVLAGADTSSVEVEVVLQAGARVGGRVTAANGRPVAGAEVTVHPLDACVEPLGTRTARDGSYRVESVPPGDFELTVFAPAHAPGLLEGSVDALETVVVDVLLESGDALCGRVLDEKGRPLAGARVEATLDERTSGSLSSGLLPPLSVGRYVARRFFRSTLTDGQGKFELRHLPSEAFLVVAEAEGYRPREVERDGSQGTTELDVVLDSLAEISGVVRVADTGGPVRDVDVQVLPLTDGGRPVPAMVRATGTGEFECVGLPAGSYSIQVAAPGYRPHREIVKLEAGEELDLEVLLERGRRVLGAVLDDATGLPVAGAMVAVRAGSGGDPLLATAVTVYSGADGSFELSGLDEEDHLLSVGRAGYERDCRDLVVDDLRGPLEVRLSPSVSVPSSTP